MKGKAKGIIQLALSILIFVLFNQFYYKVVGLMFNLSGIGYDIANFVKYLLISLIVIVIYYGNIKSDKHKFNKTLLNSFIYCLACFVFLIVVTILLHKLLNHLGSSRGITVGYGFTNYFTQKFTLKFALSFIVDTIFMPFLLCIIFTLGFSNIIKKSVPAALLSGLVYGIIYAIGLHSSFEYALFHALTPAVIIMMLTYLYKNNHNIYSVIITYICYVIFGIFAIFYIL